jgi:hypothetical protein
MMDPTIAQTTGPAAFNSLDVLGVSLRGVVARPIPPGFGASDMRFDVTADSALKPIGPGRRRAPDFDSSFINIPPKSKE